MTSNEALFQRAWEIFLERIRNKTSWGKIELEQLALDCLVKAGTEQTREEMEANAQRLQERLGRAEKML